MHWITRCLRCIHTDLMSRMNSGVLQPSQGLAVIGRFTRHNYNGEKLLPRLYQRSFHTTSRRSTIAEELSKMLGKKLQKVVTTQVKGQRSSIINILYTNWKKVVGAMTLSGGGCWYYYDSHIVEAPITKRKRFMMFTDKQFTEIGEHYRKKCMEEFKDDILPKTSTRYTRVLNVANKLLEANMDIAEIHDKKWNLTVVKRDTKDTFALACGHMFVFTGMLDICSNDDQLAVILGHEIAHCILGHSIEMISLTRFLDQLITAPAVAAWSMLPTEAISKLTQWVLGKITDKIVTQPCDQLLENEADDVGMQMVAKACFDVREGPVFWEKMVELSKDEGDNNILSIPDWQEGHAYDEERKRNLENLVPQAIQLREKCNCSSLPPRDPRTMKQYYKKRTET